MQKASRPFDVSFKSRRANRVENAVHRHTRTFTKRTVAHHTEKAVLKGKFYKTRVAKHVISRDSARDQEDARDGPGAPLPRQSVKPALMESVIHERELILVCTVRSPAPKDP